MTPLIITYIRHAVPGCCKGNVTGLEHLSYENERLIGDVCLSSGCRICKESDMRPVQGIEVVIDWFSAAMWGAIKMIIHPLVVPVNFHVCQNLLIRGMCRARTLCYK